MKNKNNKFTYIALAMFAPLTGCANPNATFKVRVIDENGQPISGVHANVVNVFDMESKSGLLSVSK